MAEPAVDTTAIGVLPGDSGLAARLVGALGVRAQVPVIGLSSTDLAATPRDNFSAIVHVSGDDARPSGAIATTEPATWDSGCEQVLWRTLEVLQFAHTAFSRGNGGRVVIVTSTAGVSGAADAVPLITALEGTRSMAKSAARQWGALGISVNCVAAPLEVLAPAFEGMTTFLPPAAISLEDSVAGVAAAVAFLCSPAADGITGATLVADGGSVMTP